MLRLLPIVALAALSTQSLAQQSATILAHRIDDHYNHLKSLRCHYTERYRGMGLDRTESGTLTLRKPGRMRWAYDSPAGKLFVLDGHSAISYTPGDAQAQRLPAKQLDDLRSPLRFLLGHTELAKELDHLNLTPFNLPDGTPVTSLSGTPKAAIGDPAARVTQITLTVDANAVIRAMRIAEADGSITDFTLTDQQENVPTRDADFTFTPPPGVSIVDAPKPI